MVTTETIDVLNNMAVNGKVNIGGVGLVTIGGKLNIGTRQIAGWVEYATHSGDSGNYNVPILGKNQQFFLYVTGSANTSVYLQTNQEGQQIYIRNAMSPGSYNNVTSLSGNNIILPTGGIGSNFSIQANHGVMLYNTGTTWIVFMSY